MRSARSRFSTYGPASFTLSSSRFCGAFHIASGVSARCRFSAASAASRFCGVECTDRTSHTNSVNGSRGGAGSVP
ncbi:MAG: hypothetical protein DMG00_08265 [Acidobacteria bacterium]|nr:MAG: hypothetical protein DMG00_08265 [Acidobacteriota bacterium]